MLEPLLGYLTLAEKAFDDAAFAGPWNFGPGVAHEKDVATLAQEACAIWGDGVTWRRDGETIHPREAHELRLDASKARARLNWRCRLDFHEMMDWTIGFYRDTGRGHDPASLMDMQIDSYLQRVMASTCASS